MPHCSGRTLPDGGGGWCSCYLSPHFRVEALRRVGGWDAWNVTEDADLGLRLAREGLGVGELPSSTFEEAPASLRRWMRQRTRWLKGLMRPETDCVFAM